MLFFYTYWGVGVTWTWNIYIYLHTYMDLLIFGLLVLKLELEQSQGSAASSAPWHQTIPTEKHRSWGTQGCWRIIFQRRHQKGGGPTVCQCLHCRCFYMFFLCINKTDCVWVTFSRLKNSDVSNSNHLPVERNLQNGDPACGWQILDAWHHWPADLRCMTNATKRPLVHPKAAFFLFGWTTLHNQRHECCRFRFLKFFRVLGTLGSGWETSTPRRWNLFVPWVPAGGDPTCHCWPLSSRLEVFSEGFFLEPPGQARKGWDAELRKSFGTFGRWRYGRNWVLRSLDGSKGCCWWLVVVVGWWLLVLFPWQWHDHESFQNQRCFSASEVEKYYKGYPLEEKKVGQGFVVTVFEQTGWGINGKR